MDTGLILALKALKQIKKMGSNIGESVADYLKNNPIGSIDKTLTKSDCAADAKVTGDEIRKNAEEIGLLRGYTASKIELNSWNDLAAAVKAGIIQERVAIGDEIENTWTDTAAQKSYSMPLRINHFEDVEIEGGKTIKGMWLQSKYATPFGVQMSQYPAFYAADEELPAGTYYITFGGTWGNVKTGESWNFTLTKAVPAGGFLAGFRNASDTASANWKVYVYDTDRKTILETVSVASGEAGTSLGTMTLYGTDHLNGIQETTRGCNRYATSALRQWLNSDKPKGEWWEPKGKYDLAPDQLATKDGFLCGIDPELLAVMQPVKLVTYCNTVTAEGKQHVKDTLYDKVTILSLGQMYITEQVSGEGEAHEYYKQLNGTDTKYKQYSTYPDLITRGADNTSVAQTVRLRSANRGNAYNSWYVNSSGGVYDGGAYYASRVAPLVLIGKSE